MSVSTFLEARALYYRVEVNGPRGDYRSFYVRLRRRQLYNVMGLIVSAEAAAVPAIATIQSCVQEFLVPHFGVQNAWQRQQALELPAPVREDDISPDFYEDIVMLEPELLGDGIRFGADFDYQMTQTLVPNRPAENTAHPIRDQRLIRCNFMVVMSLQNNTPISVICVPVSTIIHPMDAQGV